MKHSDSVRYYKSFEDDFAFSKNQDIKLPKDYKWIKVDFFSRFLSAAVYTLAFLISSVYCRLFLHVSFENIKVLKETRKTGAFIYGNHTQPVGDVFDPALACFPNRIYTVVSPANLGIPVIGKILPYLGALPIPDSVGGMKNFTAAIEYRIKQKKCIVIYPEAHVWEYYTGIRPFDSTSFKFPAKFCAPVYSMTAVYKKRKGLKKPAIKICFDGPFYPDTSLSLRDRAENLKTQVYESMKNRAKQSDCVYIKYEKEGTVNE